MITQKADERTTHIRDFSVGLLNKVMDYFSKSQSKRLPELQVGVNEPSSDEGARVVAMHHPSLEKDDVRARVAAIAVALHHHELENSGKNNDLAGLASLVAAIHHHNKKKQEIG